MPLLIEDYSAREDVFTRAVAAARAGASSPRSRRDRPRVVVVGQRRHDRWRRWRSCSSRLALLNRARGRPALSAPARHRRARSWSGSSSSRRCCPLVFGGQWRSALVTAAGNTLLLAARLRRGSATACSRSSAGRRVRPGRPARRVAPAPRARAPAAADLLARCSFLTTEMWEVFGLISGASLTAIGVTVRRAGQRLHRRAACRAMVQTLEQETSVDGPPLRHAPAASTSRS